MSKIEFLFGIHNHQPIGNFENVVEDAFERAYRPFVEVLESHPSVKMTFHFTGWLLEKLNQKHHDYIERIRDLVQHGQVEIFTGGFYEPIIPVIPEEDRIAQIKKLSDYVEKLFGKKPQGMWLAERVWEPQIAKSLALAGVKYVVVDDTHFKNAGYHEDELNGYFITEEEGYILRIFPISKRLRYLIPFESVEKTIEFLKTELNENSAECMVMFDDGEKFGVWPRTYDRVYKEKWLDEFFTAIENNSKWLGTSTFSEHVVSHSAKFRVYLPNSSYSEMMEWALPTRARGEYEELLSNVKKMENHDVFEMFIKGGIWRTFLAKYTESNLMHKKMLYLHERMENVKSSIYNEYLKAQCNDAYWHGVFGGLYLPHLRAAVYEHLIKAEKEILKGYRVEKTDYDKDGFDEVVMSNDDMSLTVDADYGARVLELNVKSANFNLINSLTRRYEVYHEWINDAITAKELEASGESKTIHDVILTKEEGLQRYLTVDWYERFSFVDHFFGPNFNLSGYSVCKYPEQGDFVNQPYEIEEENTFTRYGHVWIGPRWMPVTVKKSFHLLDKILEVEYEIKNNSEEEIKLHFGSEMVFNLMAPDAPDRYFEWKKERHAAASTVEFESNEVNIVAAYEGINISLELSETSHVYMYPIYTVSYSESGFEKVYQGTSLTPTWKFVLPSKEAKKFRISLNLKR